MQLNILTTSLAMRHQFIFDQVINVYKTET